jgi:ribosomal-protein-alanine N-acetyltransferase
VPRTRLVSLADARTLAELLRAHREVLAPYEPDRDEDYYTAEGQRAVMTEALARHAGGTTLPHVIVDDSGTVVGRITLSEIVRGPLQSCFVRYGLAPKYLRIAEAWRDHVLYQLLNPAAD